MPLVYRQRRLLCAVLILVFSSVLGLAREPNGNDRFLDAFLEDGEVLVDNWLEGRVRLNHFSGGDSVSVGPILAFNVAHDFELGLAVDFLFIDPDGAGSESGLSDLTLFGKVRLIEKPFVVSVGTVFSLPTGDEDDGLGSGEIDMEFFGAIRRSYENVAFTAHAGFRVNQDVDVAVGQGGFVSDLNGRSEGEVSYLGGAGLLFTSSEHWSYQVEVAFESGRYEGHDSSVRLTPGVSYHAKRAIYRSGLMIGLSDGAPDWALLGGAVLTF